MKAVQPLSSWPWAKLHGWKSLGEAEDISVVQEASKGLDLPVGPRTLALECEYSIHCLIFDECDNNKTCDRVIWLHISFNNIRPQPNLTRARGSFMLVHLPAQWESCSRRKLPALRFLWSTARRSYWSQKTPSFCKGQSFHFGYS